MTRDSEPSPLGELLRQYRHREHLSLRALATSTGIHHSTFARIEHGQTTCPGPELLAHLAEKLDIPLADLFALVGYTTPADLPSFTVYLRCRYHLSETAINTLERQFEKLTMNNE